MFMHLMTTEHTTMKTAPAGLGGHQHISLTSKCWIMLGQFWLKYLPTSLMVIDCEP